MAPHPHKNVETILNPAKHIGSGLIAYRKQENLQTYFVGHDFSANRAIDDGDDHPTTHAYGRTIENTARLCPWKTAAGLPSQQHDL
jgi:hypothetical protein